MCTVCGRLHSELRQVLELQQKSSRVQRQHATSPKAHQPAALQEVLDAVQQVKLSVSVDGIQNGQWVDNLSKLS